MRSQDQLPTVRPDRTLAERVQAGLSFVEHVLMLHGFTPLVDGTEEMPGCVTMQHSGLAVDATFVPCATTVGIQGRVSTNLSHATGTEAALRILIYNTAPSGACRQVTAPQLLHVSLDPNRPVEREVVYSIFRALRDCGKASNPAPVTFLDRETHLLGQ